MRFVLPAGRARSAAVAVAGVVLLGWLSGLGPVREATVPPVGVTGSNRPALPRLASGKAPALPVQRFLHTGRHATRPRVDCRRVKCVALTFDDGPGPYTTRLLGMLAARHVHVTFFLIGGNIRGREAIVRQELAEGHAIGDHSWSHPDLSRLPASAVRSQLARTQGEIVRTTGMPTRLMRPPYGATDRQVGKVAESLGLAEIIWNVDTNDWRDHNPPLVAHRAITEARRGCIILMHDIHPTTVAAVPKILRGLAKRGFTFATVPELLAAHPIRPGKLYFDEG
jgi:peptidoglycan-N-acetylglucosamine deacetylase